MAERNRRAGLRRPSLDWVLALLRETPRPNWRADALCAQIDLDLFHPEDSGATITAKRICQTCPVRADCLRQALVEDEPHGIWGGLSRNQRSRLRRDPAIKAALGLAPRLGSAHQTSAGTWRARYAYNEQQFARTFPTRQEAEGWLAEEQCRLHGLTRAQPSTPSQEARGDVA